MKVRNDENGGSLIEFAFILVIFLVLAFGMIEFSIMLFDKAVITNGSREGARAGIVFSNPRISDGEIRTIVNNYCASNLISFDSGSTVSTDITRSGTGIDAGDSLTVTVNYPFRFLVFSSLMGFLNSSWADFIDLSAVTVMRLE